jgi:hypothetical protein
MTIRAFLLVVACVTLPACDDGSAAGEGPTTLGTCGIRAEVSGAASIRFTGVDDAACATQHSFDTGLDVLFIGTNSKGTIELAVDDVAEGETGSDYPTRVVVTSMTNERWGSNGCLASISEHRLLELESSEIGELRHHRVSGEGRCAASLEAESAGADGVTLGPFTFRAEFTWRD